MSGGSATIFSSSISEPAISGQTNSGAYVGTIFEAKASVSLDLGNFYFMKVHGTAVCFLIKCV